MRIHVTAWGSECPPSARGRLGVIVFAVSLFACAGDGIEHAQLQYPDQCEPGRAPDLECYRTRRDPQSEGVALAAAITRRYMDEHPPTDLPWDWGEGVLMFGLVELHRVTGDDTLREYYQAWMDTHLAARDYRIMWSDSCPPALTALYLYQQTGNEAYLAVVREVIDYLYHVAPRTPEGGIAHLGVVVPSDSLWVDSLFMFGMVLSRWGEHASEVDALDLLGEQFAIFADLLEDEPGLLTHAHNWVPQDPGVFWARGNSWVMGSAVEYLRVRRLRGEADPDVQALLERQVETVADLQDATGLWWTVINRPGETYLETSSSALFGYAMARAYRYGLLDESALSAVGTALAGVRSRIVEDDIGRPVVTGISGPTPVSTFNGYAGIERVDDETYGVGAAILLLLETSGLPL